MNNAEIIIDLDAYRHNLELLRKQAPSAAQMAVVKADGYGHGMHACARAARETGTEWIGVATPAEALELRRAGDTGAILCWLAVPGAPFAELIDADIEVTASSVAQLNEILTADKRARVQLKVDTGLNRNGAKGPAWADLVAAAASAQKWGQIEVTGIWTHLASAEQPEHEANTLQRTRFHEALEFARSAGIEPRWRHMANSAATILDPSSHFDLVRVGIASYGVRPAPNVELDGLIPAMTARARLAHVKEVNAGESVSYGWTWTADRPTRVGLVPVGYGDGLPRAGSNTANVGFSGTQIPVRGTMCMDQFLVDLGELPARAGDSVTIFGPGFSGEPTAEDWAVATGTIGYEIVTRLRGRWATVLRGAR